MNSTLTSYFDRDIPAMVVASLFKRYDTDNNGYLNKSEVRQFLCDDLGMTLEEANGMNLLMDKDADSNISFPEFSYWLQNAGNIIKENTKYTIMQKAATSFMKLDKDKNGALDIEEVKSLMVSLGAKLKKKHLKQQFAHMDSDGNGKISFSEFLRWLNWLPTEEWIYKEIGGAV